MKGYVQAVAVERRSPTSWLAFGAGLLLLLFAWLSYYAALEPIPEATEGYQRAVRATRFASMGWALFYAMLAAWLVAKVARNLFRLPSAVAGAAWLVKVRYVAIAALLFALSVGSSEPVANPEANYSDGRWMLGTAAGLVWLLFAIELIPMLRRAVVSLRSRVSSLRFKPSTVGGRESGQVRIEGTIAVGEQALPGGSRPGELVYRHYLDADEIDVIECSGFLLESRGERLFVDVIPDKTIVVPEQSFLAELGAGDRVEVWGEVLRSDAVYRGQPSRMSAGDGRMFIFEGGKTLNRRLVLAAAVELVAASSFLLVGLTYVFFVFDLYLFLIY